MKTSSNGITKLIAREGFDPVARWDGAAWTIGHGNTYYESGAKVERGDTITRTRARSLFANVLPIYERGVNNGIRVPVSQNEFDALVSFTYNVGTGAFQGSTLLRYINEGRSKSDISKQFLRWVNSGGKFVQGLRNRRLSEIEQFNSGTIPVNGTTEKIGLPLILALSTFIVIKNT